MIGCIFQLLSFISSLHCLHTHMNPCWHGPPLVLQKKTIRIITCSKYNSHTEPILESLNILRIDDIFTRQCLAFYHKVINNSVPIFCKTLFSQHSIHHGYNIRPNNLVAVPFSRTSRVRKSLRYHIPTLLKAIP